MTTNPAPCPHRRFVTADAALKSMPNAPHGAGAKRCTRCDGWHAEALVPRPIGELFKYVAAGRKPKAPPPDDAETDDEIST